MQCPRCQNDSPAQTKFCLECGERLALTRSKCRAELTGSAKFCLECGEPVARQTQSRSPESYPPKHLVDKIRMSKAPWKANTSRSRSCSPTSRARPVIPRWRSSAVPRLAVAHCHLGLGKVYQRTDQREQARRHLTTATTMYRKMDMTYWLEQAGPALRELP